MAMDNLYASLRTVKRNRDMNIQFGVKSTIARRSNGRCQNVNIKGHLEASGLLRRKTDSLTSPATSP